MRLSELALRLDVSRRTVYRAVSRGEIPAFRVGGQLLVTRKTYERILRGELDTGRAEGAAPATATG